MLQLFSELCRLKEELGEIFKEHCLKKYIQKQRGEHDR